MHRPVNLLLVCMLLVSAALHFGLLAFGAWENKTEPQPKAGVSVQFLPQASSILSARAAVVQPVSSARVEQVLPDIHLPTAATSTFSHSPPPLSPDEASTYTMQAPAQDTIARPPPLDWQPQPGIPETGESTEQIDVQTQMSEPAEPVITADRDRKEAKEQPSAAAHTGVAMERYIQSILQRIERKKHYPHQARRRRIEGKTIIGFHLLADGGIRQPVVVRTSGYEMLDQSALQAVRRAAPFAPPPEGFAKAAMVLEVVLVFQLQ